jgi:hypothetical protein
LPSSLEIIGERCFQECQILDSLEFEGDSKLARIEERAFKDTTLKELIIPADVTFLAGSVFLDLNRESIKFAPSLIHYDFNGMFLQDLSGRSVIRYFGTQMEIAMNSSVEVIGDFCFFVYPPDSKLLRIEKSAFQPDWIKSLTSVTFDTDSCLSRIDSSAFTASGLTSIHIPPVVTMISRMCFDSCQFLASVVCNGTSCLQ